MSLSPTELCSRLSRNFTLREAVRSQTAVRLGIDNTPPADRVEALALVAKRVLQPVRDAFGVPFTPSSWYRCPALNARIGGAAGSQHVVGEAVDFEVPGVSNIAVAGWIADTLAFDQLILEYHDPDDPASGWIHCSYSREHNRGEVLRFDGERYRKDPRP